MDAVSNAQIWHRRFDHLNKRSLDLLYKGNGINFDGTIVDCDVCAVGKCHQLVHLEKAQYADIIRPFQLCYGNLMGPFTPKAYGSFQDVSRITDQFTKCIAVYLLANKSLAFDPFRLFIPLVVIPCGDRVIHWRADKEGEYTGKTSNSQAVLLRDRHHTGVCSN